MTGLCQASGLRQVLHTDQMQNNGQNAPDVLIIAA